MQLTWICMTTLLAQQCATKTQAGAKHTTMHRWQASPQYRHNKQQSTNKTRDVKMFKYVYADVSWCNDRHIKTSSLVAMRSLRCWPNYFATICEQANLSLSLHRSSYNFTRAHSTTLNDPWLNWRPTLNHPTTISPLNTKTQICLNMVRWGRHTRIAQTDSNRDIDWTKANSNQELHHLSCHVIGPSKARAKLNWYENGQVEWQPLKYTALTNEASQRNEIKCEWCMYYKLWSYTLTKSDLAIFKPD